MKILNWALSPHAVERILERKISLGEIKELLEDPDDVIQQGPKYIFSKTFTHRNDNSVAAVVLEKKEDGLWLIITVMVNFKIKK
jgi:Domain of unknown function (DUF4258)